MPILEIEKSIYTCGYNYTKLKYLPRIPRKIHTYNPKIQKYLVILGGLPVNLQTWNKHADMEFWFICMPGTGQ